MNDKKKLKPSTGIKILKKIITKRRIIQATLGVIIYIAVAQYNLPISWVIIGGSAIGILFGKIFCRWMCPMGFIMEMMMGGGDDKSKMSHMYMYFKVGCPIAWISGLLNKISFLKVKLDVNSCISCGKCDSVCYITTHNSTHSLHKGGLLNSSSHYSCSRCMDCIKSCPTGALSFSSKLNNFIPDVQNKHSAKPKQ